MVLEAFPLDFATRLTLRITRGRNGRGPAFLCKGRDGSTVGFIRLFDGPNSDLRLSSYLNPWWSHEARHAPFDVSSTLHSSSILLGAGPAVSCHSGFQAPPTATQSSYG